MRDADAMRWRDYASSSCSTKEWPAGEIKGIKARGNYEINLVWNNGKVSKASITSKNAGNLTVKYNGKQKALNFKAGETKLIK